MVSYFLYGTNINLFGEICIIFEIKKLSALNKQDNNFIKLEIGIKSLLEKVVDKYLLFLWLLLYDVECFYSTFSLIMGIIRFRNAIDFNRLFVYT